MSELTEDELKNNYREVKERIAEAAKRAGRDPKEVTLLAVSKTKPVSNIRTLMAEGQRSVKTTCRSSRRRSVRSGMRPSGT